MPTKKIKEQSNEEILSLISTKEKEIKELKSQLKPIEPAKQATLADCNKMASKVKTKSSTTNPKLLSKERA